MRRENRRRQRDDDGLDAKKMLYITGSVLALAVIVFVVTFLVYGNTLNNSSELARLNSDNSNNTIGNLVAVEETSTSYGKTVSEMEESSEVTNKEKIAVNTSQVEEKDKTTTEKNTANTTTTKKTEKVKDPEFKMPVTGEVMKEFADNKLVYSSTLDVWATHNGIDIKADKTTVVKASADGKVVSIKNDPRYGLTVIIEHVNGYKTVYANLLSTEFVVEGENVKQGQSIGTVGNTAAFEVSDEPHLHFELLKNNEEQDPELYLKK